MRRARAGVAPRRARGRRHCRAARRERPAQVVARARWCTPSMYESCCVLDCLFEPEHRVLCAIPARICVDRCVGSFVLWAHAKGHSDGQSGQLATKDCVIVRTRVTRSCGARTRRAPAARGRCGAHGGSRCRCGAQARHVRGPRATAHVARSSLHSHSSRVRQGLLRAPGTLRQSLVVPSGCKASRCSRLCSSGQQSSSSTSRSCCRLLCRNPER